MSSAQGRFTSPDPIHFLPQKLLDPQQWNMYAYAMPKPVVIASVKEGLLVSFTSVPYAQHFDGMLVDSAEHGAVVANTETEISMRRLKSNRAPRSQPFAIVWNCYPHD